MAETLSGLELRKAVALKRGALVRQNKNYPLHLSWQFSHPYGESTWHGSEEAAWLACPAFERDLGALQQAGVIDAIASVHPQMTQQIFLNGEGASVSLTDIHGADMWPVYMVEGGKPSEALATAICRAFLNLSSDK
jgi:hypothetical protein